MKKMFLLGVLFILCFSMSTPALGRSESSAAQASAVLNVFQDVPFGYWAVAWINDLYREGVTGGCGTSPLRYCPEAEVTRAQMAIFLLRAIHGSAYTPPPAADIFSDVPASYWANAWINELYAEGITGGCTLTPLNFCPDVVVTRAQMAVFLLRAIHGSAFTPTPGADIFSDVPSDYWARDWIDQLYAEGVTGGCRTSPLAFCPDQNVNRAQMAVFLLRAIHGNTYAPPTIDWWKPTPAQPIHWHWQLSDTFVYPRDVVPGVTVYDLDGELTSAETVAQLHALGPNVIVICYFDAGVYEAYRSDASRFPQSVIGKPDVGWNDSYWLDIRQTDVLIPIMKDRIQYWCRDKGFDAVEPDETEVWSNDSGFNITKAQNNEYNRLIAELAHSFGLSVGLKGNTTEAPELWQYFDWSLNEQCWEFSECSFLKDSFLSNDKAVFNIEYNVDPLCSQANTWHMNSARRDLDLVGPTNPNYFYQPCIPNSQDIWN